MARPLAVLTVLMTVVTWLRPSMSGVHRGIFWVQAVRCQSGISFSDTVSRTWFIQALAAIMQFRNICHRRRTASKGTIFSNWQNSCRAVSNNGGLSALRGFLSAGSAEVNKRSLAEAESHTILIHWLSVPHNHIHMSEDLLFSVCLIV